MELLYRIINFLILAAIIVIFARKTVIKLFRSRRERIMEELDKADRMENIDVPVFDASCDIEDITADDSELTAAKQTADAKLRQIQAFGERECREIHREMIEKARNELFLMTKKNVAKLFNSEPYKSAIRNKEPQLVDEILKHVKLTPGDMAYLKRCDVLYVTLTSAYPLPQILIDKIDSFTTDMLEKVNGKTSLWVKIDSSLIGGLKLRIGDTVYDCTIEEELYQFSKSLSKDPIHSDDAAIELLNEFADKAKNVTPFVHEYQLGRVITISDGICWMDGLADIMYGEVIEFECGEHGMVLDIQPDRIGCVIFGEYAHIESESRVRRVGKMASVPVGDCMLGRVVNAVGMPIDGEGHLYYTERRPIECKAPAILDRAPVNTPLHTGIKAIDTLVPIGKGQRELIIGDRQTGKSAIAVDTIINQKNTGTICIYVAIGQKETSIAEIKEKLESHGAMEYTTIISSPASESAALQYIAPFAGTAIAEHFMYSGKDVLIIYDDLSKHAVAYRELSLLLHRPSGREAYPGDIFYLHSRLLERSAHLSDELGGGSITALPIIETLAGDISAYIPTNVISITDGQIFLDGELFHEGQRPAVNVGLSVSRVGGAAQSKLTKQVSANLRTNLAQYRELADFTQFGTDIDEQTQTTLNSGGRLMAALRQERYAPVEDWKQALLLFAVSEGFAKDIELTDMEQFENGLYEYFETNCTDIVTILKTGAKMSPEFANTVKREIADYIERLR